MKYPRFEILAFILGTAAIAGSLLVPSTTQVMPAEVVGQLLLVLVLAGALHWGREGGFVTALIAVVIYVGMRYPLMRTEGLSSDIVTMIASRAIAYTVVGLAGGELAGRVKYLFARIEREAMIDPVTRVYSARYAGETIACALGKHRRYETPCSVLHLKVSPAVWSDLKTSRMSALMRRVASHLRNNVRMVDDVAYNGNAGFIIILPETGSDGADVVARRVHLGIVDTIGCSADEVTFEKLVCGTDDARLEELAGVLAPDHEETSDPDLSRRNQLRRASDGADAHR